MSVGNSSTGETRTILTIEQAKRPNLYSLSDDGFLQIDDSDVLLRKVDHILSEEKAKIDTGPSPVEKQTGSILDADALKTQPTRETDWLKQLHTKREAPKKKERKHYKKKTKPNGPKLLGSKPQRVHKHPPTEHWHRRHHIKN